MLVTVGAKIPQNFPTYSVTVQWHNTSRTAQQLALVLEKFLTSFFVLDFDQMNILITMKLFFFSVPSPLVTLML